MMTTGRVRGKRITMILQERLQKMSTMVRRRTMKMMPSSLTLTLPPPKHWTQSQQAQQDKQESSLVREILSDDEKQQKSWMEAQKASKESASPSEGQPSSQGEGSGPVPGEPDLQDLGTEYESAVKEVAKLNTKNRLQMKALLEARDQCYEADKLSPQKV